MQGNAIDSAFTQAVSQATLAFGQASTTAAGNLQTALSAASATETLLVAEADGAWQDGQAQVFGTQAQANIQAQYDWRATEKTAGYQLQVAQATADQVQALAMDDAYSALRQAGADAQTAWTGAVNAAAGSLTVTLNSARRDYTSSLVSAQNNWQTAMTQGQAQFTHDVTVAQSGYQLAVTQSAVTWQNAVAGAQAADTQAEANAAQVHVAAEAADYALQVKSLAQSQADLTHTWNLAQGTNWSAYQDSKAAAWNIDAGQAGDATAAVSTEEAQDSGAFFAAAAQAKLTATQAQGTALLNATALANAVWSQYADDLDAAQTIGSTLSNAAFQAYFTDLSSAQDATTRPPPPPMRTSARPTLTP